MRKLKKQNIELFKKPNVENYENITRLIVEAEKTDFHNRADRNIWAAWSNRAKLKVVDLHPFKANVLPINLDVRRVVEGHH